MTRTRRTLACAALAATLALAGCSTTVSLAPADDANNAHCADVMVRLPGTISTSDRVWTDAQSTASWGTPSAAILACGVAVPGPTTLKCVSFHGVDWIIQPETGSTYRVTTFGRRPAVQLLIDTKKIDSNAVLNAVSLAATTLPRHGDGCTAPETPPS